MAFYDFKAVGYDVADCLILQPAGPFYGRSGHVFPNRLPCNPQHVMGGPAQTSYRIQGFRSGRRLRLRKQGIHGPAQHGPLVDGLPDPLGNPIPQPQKLFVRTAGKMAVLPHKGRGIFIEGFFLHPFHYPDPAPDYVINSQPRFFSFAQNKGMGQLVRPIGQHWGEILGLSPEQATERRLAAAVRALGVRHVFDTTFSADLTIMEESSEFVERLTKPGSGELPQFTSCCPGWVRFVRTEYPEMAANLSTAKSPQQMFGAVAKSYYAEKLGKAPEDIFCVSVMPCTAKKYESATPEVSDAASQDVDVVLTTRELDRMLRAMQINVAALPEEDFDSPLGRGSGAGVIFGVTGGVMEAALRTAYWQLTGSNPPADAFQEIRGQKPWREASFTIGETTVRLAVASGLGSARQLMDALRSGQVHYDFVEVMACPGGCSGGGGQPIHDGQDFAAQRGQQLYQLDAESPIRFSHENPDVQALYREYLGQPLSEKAHHLLHTDQRTWTL